MSIPSPRPRDVLRAELIRLSAARRTALLVHVDADAATRRAVRGFYDRRIAALVDELADTLRPTA